MPDPLVSRTPPELALVWRPIFPQEFLTDPAARALTLEVSPQIASLAPIHDVCQTACSAEVAACTATGASLMSAAVGVFPFASPSEALLTTADYWASPRFEEDRARLLAAIVDPDAQGAFVDMNACFMDAAAR